MAETTDETPGKDGKKRRWTRAPGAPPGTLSIHPSASPPRFRVITYGPEELEDDTPETLDELFDLAEEGVVTWVDVVGLGDADKLLRIGQHFELHPLALEDAVHGQHAAKTETFPDYVFVIARIAEPAEGVDTSQVSFFVTDGLVVSFRESPTDPFEPVRERIHRGGQRLRNRNADYLAYALLDALIDAYLPILEHYGDQLEELEDRIFERPDDSQLGEIHRRRREIVALRKAFWPHREAVQVLLRETPHTFTAETQVFLRDCYDHVLRIIDLLETYRDQTSSLMEVYLSSLGQRTNEVMKVLTIIATIFIPLSFLAGLYGMNFDTASPWNLPELGWRFGYPALLGVMAMVAGGFVWYFRSKDWL